MDDNGVKKIDMLELVCSDLTKQLGKLEVILDRQEKNTNKQQTDTIKLFGKFDSTNQVVMSNRELYMLHIKTMQIDIKELKAWRTWLMGSSLLALFGLIGNLVL